MPVRSASPTSTSAELERAGHATASPAVNQVQFSPFEYRRALLEACRDRKIAVEAYSPLGTGRHLSDETVERIASVSADPRTGAAALVPSARARATIPKSTHRERIEENARIFDFTLSDQDMAELDTRDETGGTDRALERKWW